MGVNFSSSSIFVNKSVTVEKAESLTSILFFLGSDIFSLGEARASQMSLTESPFLSQHIWDLLHRSSIKYCGLLRFENTTIKSRENDSLSTVI